jgi:hypothetical protein
MSVHTDNPLCFRMQIKGTLRKANLKERTFRVYQTATKQAFVFCHYESLLQPAVREALGQYVMVTGEATLKEPSGPVIEFCATDIEVLGEEAANLLDIEKSSPRRMTARDLLSSGLVGIWKNRKDIGDSRTFARKLRERAQRRPPV